MSPAQIIIGVISWCFIFIAMIIFLSICVTVYKSRREMEDVSMLLICNTCLGALLTCFTMCITIGSDLTTGFLTNNLHFCYAWGLFYDISQCSIYYSYCLQAIFRLCRIVFYKKKSLVSYSLYIIMSISQWLLTLALLLPPIPLKWYSRLPTEKYCLIPYTDVGGEMYHITILYVIPLVCISTTYVWIIIFVRYFSRTTTVVIAATQRQRNLRDLTIVKRIVILVSVLVLLRFPTIIFMIYGITSGGIYSLTYSIVGLITSVCLIIIGCMTIYITPPLRKNIFILYICHYSRANVQTASRQVSRTSVAVVGTGGAYNQDRLANLSDDTVTEHKI